MKTNRRGLIAIAGALSVAALALGASFTTAVAQEVTLRLHQFLPQQANVPKHILDKWIADVEAAAGGKLKVEHYPAMQLGGKPPELIDQAIDGVADIVWTVVGYTPGRFPRTEVFELPFMMTNAEATSRAYWEMFEKDMKDAEFKDVHIIGAWVHGPGLIHSDRPVRTPADLNGMKVRGGSRTVNMLLETLGATPVGMPVPAVSEALSKGVINATTIPWEVTPALKVSELVKNHTEFAGNALYTVTFVLAMNKAKYESLPADIKAAVDANSGIEFSAFAGKTQAYYDEPAREVAVKLGNNIMTLTPEETEVWRQAAAPVYEKWIADMATKGYDGAALIEEAKGLIAKYTK
jgi:C4-dicarboxylate-binding protein DctP